jgi:hypothetical protein
MVVMRLVGIAKGMFILESDAQQVPILYAGGSSFL